jgi:hypothetical protein
MRQIRSLIVLLAMVVLLGCCCGPQEATKPPAGQPEVASEDFEKGKPEVMSEEPADTGEEDAAAGENGD